MLQFYQTLWILHSKIPLHHYMIVAHLIVASLHDIPPIDNKSCKPPKTLIIPRINNPFYAHHYVSPCSSNKILIFVWKIDLLMKKCWSWMAWTRFFIKKKYTFWLVGFNPPPWIRRAIRIAYMTRKCNLMLSLDMMRCGTITRSSPLII
jgi:hypothetical protein